MISIYDINDAYGNIADVIRRTPVLTSRTLSAKTDNKMFLKGEHLQPTGAFKIRGATNKVRTVAEEGAKHIVTASSGNHGQAVAYIAGKLGLEATIVVPENAVSSKVAAIRGYGANIMTCGTTSTERLQKAEELTTEQEAVFIPPYDDPLIMAGQGTAGVEILEQIPDVDAIYITIGGGGLISGIATAVKESRPDVKVIGVEPEQANDTFLSKKQGKLTAIERADTIADGLRASQPGDLTFPVVQKYVDDIVLVTEDEITEALVFVLERMKQLIEPSAAVAVAAAMTNKAGLHEKNICSVVSGGNMALDKLAGIIGGLSPVTLTR
ncbi:threonine/serine dehydratase [Lentibacillus sp. CBA3610]|uniref:threonine ammonia-lyase n=1 Tax=Lentibacillus sp. CBA3610 TaxID=2518176 RepID=UPI0015953107|nr:threonine/serine dehydratase [Lentibacillus sp. CBA3610]QKY70339.1 pyridoxal-phosphate dependent enzyme [Lentibacillus sp. CBA3610]